MELKDIKTLQQVARESGISVRTLQDRLTIKSSEMIDGLDFRKLGGKLPTLLSPTGIEKILKKLK